MLEIDEQRSIQPPVVRHSFALAFAGLHGQQHVERVTGESGQTEDNDGHDPEGQETLQKPDQNVALHPSLLSYGASLMYSRWVKNPVILPGKVYSAMYFGFTPASANSQNSGMSANSLNLWSPISRSSRARSALSTTLPRASRRSSMYGCS